MVPVEPQHYQAFENNTGFNVAMVKASYVRETASSKRIEVAEWVVNMCMIRYCSIG